MMASLREILSGVAGVLGAAGCCYYALCLYGARSFRNSARSTGVPPVTQNADSSVTGETPVLPPVSILKPLKGTDPEIYESFRSHCLQDYPEYELIFGVGDPDDPAAAMVRRLQFEFPEKKIRIEICPKVLGTNRKVGVLAQLVKLARYDHLLVNDSDILVGSDYLRRVMALFTDERGPRVANPMPNAHSRKPVGLVTCLYRGIPSGTIGSRLEALGIGTDFAPSVLAARVLQGVRFGLGSTLAFPRRALDAIGGFEPLSDYLADDYELGARIAAAGFTVVLSDVVVDHHLPAYAFPDFVAHQLRWARAIRDSRPWGYAGMAVTFGALWAALAVALSTGARWSWALLGVAAALRVAVAFSVGRGIVGDKIALRHLVLLPLRDLVAFCLWIASFTGHTVNWRGDIFILDKGKLRPILSDRN